MLFEAFEQLSASLDEATGLGRKPTSLANWGTQLWNKILGPGTPGPG